MIHMVWTYDIAYIGRTIWEYLDLVWLTDAILIVDFWHVCNILCRNKFQGQVEIKNTYDNDIYKKLKKLEHFKSHNWYDPDRIIR